MKEIEIFVEVLENKDKALEKLGKFKNMGVKEVKDTYFYDPKRKELVYNQNGLKNSFRLRMKDGKTSIAYKKDHFDSNKKWIYSDEYETEVKDYANSLKIIESLGLKELVIINNKKHTFESEKYEIVLEEIEELGLFMEVEALEECKDDEVNKIKKEILEFIDSLHIEVGEELNVGKPELMIKRSLDKH